MNLLHAFRGAAGAVVRLALPAVLVVASAAAWSQMPRPVQIPANAIYGDMKWFRYPEAMMGKKIVRFAPGARIYDVNNLIIQPAMVPSAGPVLFRLDVQGQVTQMWLLRPDEAAAAKERAKKAEKK